jgi:hypothetical protein
MAAVHAATSYPLRTSPVLRGKWVLDVLLGEPVPPPPPEATSLKVDEATVTPTALREQLELHRKNPECASCHKRMDPLGFGLEVFDVLGRLRQSPSGQPIDATGTLPSGETFTGPTGLKDVLLKRKPQFTRHFVRKLTGYAFGRELNKFDDCVVRDATAALEANNGRVSAAIEVIAQSRPFRYRFYAKAETNDSP